jgi:hypothetical protein
MIAQGNYFAPLPSEMRRRQLLERLEAEQGVQWRDDCPTEVGRKIAAIIPELTNAAFRVFRLADKHRVFGSASGESGSGSEECLNGEGADEERLDAVAAVMHAFSYLSKTDQEDLGGSWGQQDADPPVYHFSELRDFVNDVLLAARVEWHYVEGQFVPRGNSVLHTGIVKPATILLDSDPVFTKASACFNKAITRLSENKPDVAITDAATALQEMFRELGIHGNSVSDQVNEAQRANIISKADRGLLKPIVDWVNGDRSERGNAHHHRDGDVSRADAWLMIHVAGALMVRLSNRDPRDIVASRQKRDEEAAEQERRTELQAKHDLAQEMETNGYHWNPQEPPF